MRIHHALEDAWGEAATAGGFSSRAGGGFRLLGGGGGVRFADTQKIAGASSVGVRIIRAASSRVEVRIIRASNVGVRIMVKSMCVVRVCADAVFSHVRCIH